MMLRRGVLLAVAGVLLVPVCVVVTIVAAVLWRATIDLSRWRDAAADRLATALERPVRLHGALTLTLGRDSTLRVGGVEVSSAPAFSGDALATLSDVALRFDLLEAVRGALRVRSVEADHGRLWLARTADGRANWTAARAVSASPGTVRIDEIALRNLDLEYVDARGGRRFRANFDELTASGRADEPLRLRLRGRTRSASYMLIVTGGAPETLLAGAAPWPFDLVFEQADARLEARGTVAAGTQVIDITALRARLGDADASGALVLDLRDERPRLRGSLAIARLDLTHFPGADADANGSERFEHVLVRDLIPIDLEVDVHVSEFAGVPGDLRDVRLELRAAQGRVHAPMRGAWSGVPLSGALDLDATAAVPTLALGLEARGAALRDLPQDLVGAAGASGEVGHVILRAESRGETVGALARALDLTLSAATRLRFEHAGGPLPLAVTLDAVDISMRRGERLHGRARGALQGERVTLTVEAGALPDMLARRATPLDLDLAAARARLRMAGTLALPGTGQEATDLAFDFRAARAGDLARWLPVASGSRLALDARGRVRVGDEGWRIDATRLAIGRSTLAVAAGRSNRAKQPVTQVAVRGPLLDLTQLETLLPRGNAASRIDAGPPAATVRHADADIELALERVVWRRFDLQDVGVTARLRAGHLAPSPVFARFAGARFQGEAAAGLTGAAAGVDLRLSAAAVDLGLLLQTLGATRGVEGRVNALDVDLHARGNTLPELAQQSSFAARVRDADVTFIPAAPQPSARIYVTEATLQAPAGDPVQFHLAGTFDEEPVDLRLATGRLGDLMADTARVPVDATATVAGTHLALAGHVLLPLGRGGELAVQLQGERLDRLSGLAAVELPAWGPWSLRGPIHMTADGYELPDVRVQVGTSTLTGSARIHSTGVRPRLVAYVNAPRVQLDDFPLPERLTDDSVPSLTTAGVRATARVAARRTERVLTASVLRRADAYVDVRVKEVLSGTDRLADGHLRIQVSEGQLYLGPARVELPGGTLTLAVAYDPAPSQVRLRAGAYIERFDYGILARRLDRGDNVRGLISAQIELAGTAPSLDRIMRYADGRMDFAIWPDELGGGAFNLWSVNLLLAVLPVIDPGGASHVNCIVGRFDLHDGVLQDDKLLIDTTRVRVRGAGTANLKTEDLDFVFRPRAKGLALFRLQNPLRVTGTLNDYHIGMDQRDLLPSTLRMLASPILVPWERLTQGPLPRDGADVCTDPLRQ